MPRSSHPGAAIAHGRAQISGGQRTGGGLRRHPIQFAVRRSAVKPGFQDISCPEVFQKWSFNVIGGNVR